VVLGGGDVKGGAGGGSWEVVVSQLKTLDDFSWRCCQRGGKGMYGATVIVVLGVEIHRVRTCRIMEDVGHAIVRADVRIAGMRRIHQTTCGPVIADCEMCEMREGYEMR